MTQANLTIPAPSERRRTQAERREASGRGLVTAAIAVISEEGVSAATFENIGARGGYSRGLVGQRFGSKHGLIQAVIDHLHDQYDPLAAAEGIDTLPGLQALLAYVDFSLRMISEGEAYTRLVSSAVADNSPLQATFAAEHNRARDRLAGFFKRGQEDGSIRHEIAPNAAALIVGSLLLGLSMQILIDRSMDVDAIRTTCLATLRQAFAPS